MPGQIGQIGHHLNGFPPNSTRHHPNGSPPNLTTQFDQAGIQCNLNGFPPNSTRQAYNVISMDFHPIQPLYLTDSTRQAYNVISMDFHPS